MNMFYTEKDCEEFIAKNNLVAIPMPFYSEWEDNLVLFWYVYYI